MDLMSVLKKYFVKYRQIIIYFFCGGLTTFVNYVIYFTCTILLNLNHLIANIIAWIFGVSFAFIVNKIFVFDSKSWAGKDVFSEAWKFVSARIFSGFLETFLLWFFVDIIGMSDKVIKIAASVLVVILNYVFSKFIVFKKEGTN